MALLETYLYIGKAFLSLYGLIGENETKKNDLFRTVLDEDNNLSPKDREYFHYLARVSSHINYKTLERLGVNAKALTVDEVKAILVTLLIS